VESLTEKLDDIYSDLESNVTQIWRRRDYHLAIDLAYHSVLYMDFLGSSQLKGYIELLVVGDTREGKSQTANRLRDHYGLGTKIDCKNVSLAGLTGGVDTKGSRAFAR
jgi:DNA replicative helicase MCM subunit Mcm2 (Cdc46/Mcm family)